MTAGPASRLIMGSGRADRVRHLETLPERRAQSAPWPDWANPDLVRALQGQGIDRPWAHQVHAAQALWAGDHVALATGTASGKSLAYWLPVLSAALDGARAPNGRGATALYVTPTKALAGDQLARLEALGLTRLRAATFDGDTLGEDRRWARDHAAVVLTNPDMLHYALLPGHHHWAPFLRRLRFVVLDESHHYRGVFGSHVAAILRRLRRVAAHYDAYPRFVTASATSADPELAARCLTGLPATAVTTDASPRGRTQFVLWQPALARGGGEPGVPTRRSAITEGGELLADLVAAGQRTLAFVGSRAGVESVAASARRLLADVEPALSQRVAAYRGGYLPEERRALEQALRDGRLVGLAATNALELGIDIAGLDAVLICGWPGRLASFWQQAGRAGRRHGEALVVLVARDDPLDTYLVHHPEAIFGHAVEATVSDPTNPYVLAPQLCAAAAELPLTGADLDLFGPTTQQLLDALVERGALRRRPAGWFWTRPDRAADLVDLRGTGGASIRIVEEVTGRVLGTVDAGAGDRTVHDGAVYLHQGASWLVRHLDQADAVALVQATDDAVTTHARAVTDIRVMAEQERCDWGSVVLRLGTVEVTTQVVSFQRREARSGQVVGEEPLDLPVRTLRTVAVWWTMPASLLDRAGVSAGDIPGAAHAAEHAAIGLLPLVATCDRWDVGGVSTAVHPDTGLPTIFIYDGHAGGAGFAERGYRAAQRWLTATAQVIDACECEAGCPSCVQSPKCGNGNEPLDKQAASRLLRSVLAGA